jgi:hypothetical protein
MNKEKNKQEFIFKRIIGKNRTFIGFIKKIGEKIL